jgi:hypothetical protein
MVSPVDKNGADAVIVEGGENKTRASTSGEALTYGSAGSFAGPVGAKFRNQYVSRRGAGGWSTQSITPPTSAFATTIFPLPYEDLLFTPNLSKGITTNGDPPLTSDAPAGYDNVYIADTADGAYQLVSSPEPGAEPYTFEPGPDLGGASTDLSHVVFGEQERAGLSEWVDGHLSVIEPPGAEARAGNGQPSILRVAVRWHAVSADGSRVFFTSPVENRFSRNQETPINNQLYVRENGTTTVEASASQRAPEDINGPRGAEFAGASADGSVVFFTSRAELTEDANTGSADNAANLYAYDTNSGQLTDLSVDGNAGDLNGAAVLGMVSTSEDGAYVYYVAEGDLAGAAVSGKPNLYLHHNGTTTFIATLATADAGDWAELTGGPAGHTARVTPDGVHLAFLSTNSLTGYDNTVAQGTSCGLNQFGGPLPASCTEVFSYNAGSGVLSCVSCNPSGVRPIGSSSLGDKVSNFYIARNFSEDGSRLFFQSSDALVRHDSNGRQDVYEYEGGHVYPVSDVAGSFDSIFMDASPTGDDVFIATADQLLPQDQDLRVDVYDARVSGGFPVAAVPPPACDNGDACKPPVSPQPPVFGAPASATFSGAGNLAPQSPPPPPAKGKTATQILAEHLAKALRACRAKKNKHKRAECEKQARKRFGPAKKASTHSKKGRK